jgi:hypothetical protein
MTQPLSKRHRANPLAGKHLMMMMTIKEEKKKKELVT